MTRKKFICLVILFSFCSVFLTGCYDLNGIEQFSYAIAIGIDASDINIIKLSLQFTIATSSGGEGTTSQSSNSTVVSVDCDSIDSGINLINSYVGKQVNLSHCKAIVISEPVAVEGVSQYLYTLINNIQIRPDCNIIISRCNAKDFLENSTSSFESLPARYYETAIESSQYTGLAETTPIHKFYSYIEDDFREATAVLGGLLSENNQSSIENQPYINLDGNYKVNETPVSGENKIDNMGIAIFSGDKLVGEVNGLETISHLLLTNKLKKCVITISSPFKENRPISLFITSPKSTVQTVEIVNGSPYITTEVFLEANILSADNDSDYTSIGNLKIIEEYVNNYMQEQLSSFLYRTAKEFKSDVIGFGRHLRTKYLTEEKLNQISWSTLYPNSFFSCKVHCTVGSGYVISKD